MSFHARDLNDSTVVGRIYDALRLNVTGAQMLSDVRAHFVGAGYGSTVLLGETYSFPCHQESFSLQPLEVFYVNEMQSSIEPHKIGDYYGMDFNYDQKRYELVCSSHGYCELSKQYEPLAMVDKDGKVIDLNVGGSEDIVDVLSYAIHSILGLEKRNPADLSLASSLMLCDADAVGCVGI